MVNNWHSIWDNRRVNDEILLANDEKKLFLEMKRINGDDITDGISYEAYMAHHKSLKEKLRLEKGDSVFEIGCGCGANLFLFEKEGISVGGIDYSSSMIGVMERMIHPQKLIESICGEARYTPINLRYDAVFCYGVCQYFPDFSYAENVLEAMMKKSNTVFSMMCVHDVDKKKDFLNNRRGIDPLYDQKYKDLPKLFYSKQFFEDFAKRNRLNLEITSLPLAGFWNEKYVFDCFFYK